MQKDDKEREENMQDRADPGAIDLEVIKAKRIGDTAGCTSRKSPLDPWRNLHPQDIDALIAVVKALRERVVELEGACRIVLAELPEDDEGIEIGDLQRLLCVCRAAANRKT